MGIMIIFIIIIIVSVMHHYELIERERYNYITSTSLKQNTPDNLSMVELWNIYIIKIRVIRL